MEWCSWYGTAHNCGSRIFERQDFLRLHITQLTTYCIYKTRLVIRFLTILHINFILLNTVLSRYQFPTSEWWRYHWTKCDEAFQPYSNTRKIQDVVAQLFMVDLEVWSSTFPSYQLFSFPILDPSPSRLHSAFPHLNSRPDCTRTCEIIFPFPLKPMELSSCPNAPRQHRSYRPHQSLVFNSIQTKR